jgi:hypothetical protein
LDFTGLHALVSARAAAKNEAQRLTAGDLPGGRAVQHVTVVQRVFDHSHREQTAAHLGHGRHERLRSV